MEAPSAQNQAIVVVEDNEHDAILLMRALRALKPEWVVTTLGDAESAMRSLAPSPAIDQAPFAIVLDLSLPGIGGPELLQWIDQQRHLKAARVCVVSGRVGKPTSVPTAGGRLVCYLPKPASALAIAA